MLTQIYGVSRLQWVNWGSCHCYFLHNVFTYECDELWILYDVSRVSVYNSVCWQQDIVKITEKFGLHETDCLAAVKMTSYIYNIDKLVHKCISIALFLFDTFRLEKMSIILQKKNLNIFLGKKMWIQILLEFVPKGPDDTKSTVIQVKCLVMYRWQAITWVNYNLIP